MDDNNQIPEIQPATEQAVIGASTVCFISLIIIYCLSERAVERLGILWIEFLLYGIIPVTATFLYLYRSCWHPKITGAARTCAVLLLSCIILVGISFFIGFMLFFGFMIFHSFSDGFHP
jgi:hypothetical protein